MFARNVVALVLLSIGSAAAQQITVAAAADTSFALKEITAKFEQERGVKVKLVFGASGSLFAQIQNGAPYDLFLSADEEYPRKLEAAGLLEKPEIYAGNGLALLYRTDLKPSPSALTDYSFLADPSVKRIAIANPQHAPFGRAAMKFVLTPDLYERVKDKIVLAENVAQTTQYAVSGNVDVAIVSGSMGQAPAVRQTANLSVVAIHLEPPLQQSGGVVRATKQASVAREFFAYVRGDAACAIFFQHGFAVGCGPFQK